MCRRSGVLPMSENRRAYLLILAVTGLLGVLVGAYALLRRAAPSGPSSEAAMSPEELAYLSQIQITEARMSAAKNYIGDTVVYLDARVSNSGPRAIRELALGLEFVNTEHQIVFRSAARPISSDTRPLKPHASRPFQVPFEKLPEDWNRAAPAIKPVALRF